MPDVTLAFGCTVTFEAISPTTGAAITGVKVSNAALYGLNFTDDPVPPLPELGPEQFTVASLADNTANA